MASALLNLQSVGGALGTAIAQRSRMASSSDSSARRFRARRFAMGAARVVCVASAGVVFACASGGETGDSCWSEVECTSGNCNFDSCDGLFDLLAEVAESTEEAPAYEEPAQTLPACGDLDENTCNATAGCLARITCSPPPCLDIPAREFLACTSCYSTGCGEPCIRIYQCAVQ
jgi:hypothetical protein